MNPDRDPRIPAKQIEDASTKHLSAVNTAADDIINTGENIFSHKGVPLDTLSDIRFIIDKAKSIKIETGQLSDVIKTNISEIKGSIDNIEIKINGLNETITKQQKTISDYKERDIKQKQNEAFWTKLNPWLVAGVVGGVVSIAAGVVLMLILNGLLANWGYGIAAGGAVLGTVSMAFALQSPWIIGLGIGIVVLLAATAILRGYILLRRGIEETVKTQEKTKAALPENVKKATFDQGGIADQIQSDSTKTLVKQVRNKLKNDQNTTVV